MTLAMADPEQRDSQHMDALAIANTIRLGRSKLRKRVKAGELTVPEAADHPHAASATVYEVLKWQHKWGHARAARLLRQVAIPESKRCDSLSTRQRQALEEALGR